MARPRKAGLSYFPLDVDIFDADYKIVDLLERFGPKGFAVYIAVLCMVYREGYCLEIPMRSLQAQLGKMIGNRWLTDKALIPDVISYCGELGLFDAGLLRQGVITSAGIQRRYREATKRSKTRKIPASGGGNPGGRRKRSRKKRFCNKKRGFRGRNPHF